MTDPRRILTHIGLCCVMVAGICRDASACLRAAPDERAIQWSSAIVEAKLKVIGEPVELARVGEAEFGKPRLVHAYWYRLYTFDVTEVLDGRRVRRGRDVKVVRFFGRIDRGGPQARPCARHLGEEDVGRPFILLLRPERDLRMEVAPIDPALNDVRTEALRGLDAYAIVSLVPRAEMDPDEKAALKRRIDDVRRAERAFSVERARRAAERIIAAGDTFEAEDDAEELLAMGPRAVPVMVRVSSDRRGPRVGRDRLQVLIAQLTPPPIPVTIEGPTAVDHDEPG
jgi:hypothetical protein